MRYSLLSSLATFSSIILFALWVVINDPRVKSTTSGSDTNTDKASDVSKWFKSADDPLPTVYCIIVTTPKELDSKLGALLSMWVSECSDYEFIVTEPLRFNTSGYVNDSLFNFVQTNKYHVRDVLLEVNEEHGLKYDWFLVANGQTYVHFENFVKFLKNEDPTVSQTTRNFNSHLLSRAGLEEFARRSREDSSFCSKTEDLAFCLSELEVDQYIKMYDQENKLLFYPYNVKDAYNQKKQLQILEGYECCSDSVFLFQEMQIEHMNILTTAIRRTYDLFQRNNTRPTFHDIYDTFLFLSNFKSLLN